VNGLDLPIGEMAALTAALIWSCTSMFFTRAGRLVSPTAANGFKVVAASLIYALAMLITRGRPFGEGIDPTDVARLATSGAVGIALGDSLLFHSWQLLGTRRAMLIAAVSPVMGAVGGVLLLGDRLSVTAVLGMSLALAGVGWVIGERRPGERFRPTVPGWAARWPIGSTALGVILAVGASMGHAGGAILAKDALTRVDVLPATQIRVAGAALVMVTMAIVTGRLGTWFRGFVRHRLIAPMTLASFFGPFCGILLLSVALDHTSTGVALTLTATIPIWLLPLGAWFQNDRPSLRECAGAVIAIAGVAILMVGGASS